MNPIPTHEEFIRLRETATCYILNEDVGTKSYKLHHSSCVWLDLADGHRHSKFWCPEDKLNDAIVWLIHRHGDRWRVCTSCNLCP